MTIPFPCPEEMTVKWSDQTTDSTGMMIFIPTDIIIHIPQYIREVMDSHQEGAIRFLLTNLKDDEDFTPPAKAAFAIIGRNRLLEFEVAELPDSSEFKWHVPISPEKGILAQIEEAGHSVPYEKLTKEKLEEAFKNIYSKQSESYTGMTFRVFKKMLERK